MADGLEQKRRDTLSNPEEGAMEPLTIILQRLVKVGQTCDRCGGKHLEMRKATD